MKRLSKIVLPVMLALVPLVASAQVKLLPPCVNNPENPRLSGNCGISDIMAVFVNLAEILLGMVGAIALGYFVYGGFVFILSRGNKGEVDRAFGILRSATIGIAIIFLSGIFVRFSIQALTGGSSAIPTIGESCVSSGSGKGRSLTAEEVKSGKKGNGLWVSVPGGLLNGKVTRESLFCIKKDADCGDLNAVLENVQGRNERYSCIDISKATTSCVRGLCTSGDANFACCKK